MHFIQRTKQRHLRIDGADDQSHKIQQQITKSNSVTKWFILVVVDYPAKVKGGARDEKGVNESELADSE